MCDSEEVWQVAGHRRRRRRPDGGDTGRKQQQQPEIRRSTARGPHNSAAFSSSAAGKSKKASSRPGGYSYKAAARDSSPTDEMKEERVRQELAKLEGLKILLRGTALWERLVEGLKEILPQLGQLASHEQDGTSVTVAAAGATAVCPGWNGADDISDAITVSDRGRSSSKLRELVCYGIGNFSENHSSRYQFALALCLRDLLSHTGNDRGTLEAAAAAAAAYGSGRPASGLEQSQVQQHRDCETALPSPAPASALSVAGDCSPPETNGAQEAARGRGVSTVSMLVFDPVMGETERAILAALDCGVLENEEGKRCCCGSDGATGTKGSYCYGGESGGENRNEVVVTPTLFFMPHCPQRLYSNVLWANWSSRALGSIIILGNKISRYREDRLIDAHARDDPTNALLRAGPLLRDIDLQVPYPHSAGTPENKGRWRRDSEKLPRLERAFNDLALSFSDLDARSSAEGVAALKDRPREFVEDADGELVTGRAGT